VGGSLYDLVRDDPMRNLSRGSWKDGSRYWVCCRKLRAREREAGPIPSDTIRITFRGWRGEKTPGKRVRERAMTTKRRVTKKEGRIVRREGMRQRSLGVMLRGGGDAVDGRRGVDSDMASREDQDWFGLRERDKGLGA
jgi:hypothetical protein